MKIAEEFIDNGGYNLDGGRICAWLKDDGYSVHWYSSKDWRMDVYGEPSASADEAVLSLLDLIEVNEGDPLQKALMLIALGRVLRIAILKPTAKVGQGEGK